MVDWELMVPGMGLTILGLVTVGVSLSGIARTLMEGMHALGMLVLTIGMIILATGILKGGLPTSSTAKATVVVIIGFIVALGTFMMSLSTVPSLPLLAGILLLILVPATVISYAAHIESAHLKAIAVLFTSGSAVGAIVFVAFGFVAPQPVEAGVLERPAEPEEEIAGPKVEVTILEGASVEGAPAYEPAQVTVERGTTVVWNNADSVVHTVTNGDFDDPDFGTLFDSQTMGADATFSLNTSELEPDEYEYFCIFHPFMKAKLTVSGGGVEEGVATEEVEEESLLPLVTVDIVEGAQDPDNPEFYSPAEIIVSAGTTVVWINIDSAAHTVTNGNPGDPDSGSLFDSGFPLMKQGERFEHTFDTPGEYPYFCLVHPHMTAKVIVT